MFSSYNNKQVSVFNKFHVKSFLLIHLYWFLFVLWQESGLAVWMGGRLQPIAKVPPPVAVILITAFIACFTEFASNTATIIIFLPVIAELVSDCFIAQDLKQLQSSH